jgi:hypothetical protein
VAAGQPTDVLAIADVRQMQRRPVGHGGPADGRHLAQRTSDAL